MSAKEPAAWRFEPFDKQEAFMASDSKQILLSGAFGTGKTLVGTEKGYRFGLMYPGNRGLIIRKTFSDVKATTITQTLLEDVIPPSHIHNHNKSEHIIEHYTGTDTPDGDPVLSEIYYHGLDSGRKTGDDDLPRKIGGMEFGWIFVDEASELSEGEWTQLLGRLRFKQRRVGNYVYEIPFRQIFAATNPDHPNHWMYKWFFEDKKGEAITIQMDENPYLAQDYIEENKANYSGIYYDRYILGKWVGAEGIVYDEWLDDVHHKHPHDLPGNWEILREEEYDDGTAYWAEPPDTWRVYRSIDFGYRNPFVCYDDETEVLTDDGWKLFENLGDENVATFDTENETVEYQTPISYIEQEYNGPMVEGSSDRLGANFSVTPNHQMVLHNRDTDKYLKEDADEMEKFLGRDSHAIPVGWDCDYHGESGEEITIPHNGQTTAKDIGTLSLDGFAYFLGMVVSEGTVEQGHVRITQKKNLDTVRKALSRLFSDWYEYENKNGVTEFDVSSVDLSSFLSELEGKSQTKCIPSFVSDWPAEAKSHLLEGLIFGDGRYRGAEGDLRSSEYFTTSRQLADDVQELALSIGIPSKITQDEYDTEYSNGEIYKVAFHSYNRATLESLDLETVEYDGKVYCVEVPNGTLIVRRNGRPMVCGNCQWWARGPDDEMVLFREVYITEKLVEDAARMIKRLDPTQHIVDQSFADWDAEDRATLQRHGVDVARANKNVSAGIQSVKTRLQQDERGKPQLYIMQGARVHEPDSGLKDNGDPLKTVDEVAGYIWKENTDDDVPEKRNDHGMDSMRYMIHTIDARGSMSLEEMQSWSRTVNETW